MWKPKWLRKQVNLPVEYTTHIISYTLNHKDDNTTVTLTVHLPSKRVSEKYYNETGTLKRYVHSSPMANEHIEYLCSRDNKLAYNIGVSESMKRHHKPIAKRKGIFNLLKTIFYRILIGLSMAWMIYLLYLLIRGIV